MNPDLAEGNYRPLNQKELQIIKNYWLYNICSG